MTSVRTDFEIRRAQDRGTTDIGWLHGRHSFSFNRYSDPSRHAYHTLRVLNDDIIKAGRGFGEHGHDHMEIITWILEGELAHADSTGNRGTIKPGDVQVMSAGSGIRHSEMNASKTQPAHLLQIWIEPDRLDLEPSYAQKFFSAKGRHNRWQPIASPDRRDGSLRIHQDAAVYITDLDADATIALNLSEERHGYLHVATGSVRLGEHELRAGDAVTFSGQVAESIAAMAAAQLLLFDLP